jgi:hypothetical protein
MNELPLGSLPRISTIPGPRGPKGDKGDPGTNGSAGVSPSTTTTASFVMPAAGGTVTVTTLATSWVVAGVPIYIETAGHFVVSTVLSAISLSLTAQTATGNATAGTVITAGKRVVPGARMTADTAQIDSIGNRVTALESGNAAGNRNWYATTAPSNSGGALRTGDIWYDTDDGYKMYRWDGTQWTVAQRSLALADFGTGIRPIVKVTSLPTSGYVDGDFVWLQTDGKLYRRVSGSWTKAIASGDLVGQIDGQTMIVDGTIIAQKLGANSVTADKVGANQIITQAANIGDGTITDAKISTLSAGKISAGDIQSVNIGYAGGIFHPSYITGAYAGRYFRTTEYGTSFADNFTFAAGTAFTFTQPTPVTAYGPGNASWRLNGSPAMCPDSGNSLGVQIEGRLIGYYGNILLYCRVNGGQFVPLASRFSRDGDDAICNAFRRISGVTAASKVEFFVAPANGVGTISTNVTCRYELDVLFYNW